MVKTSRIFIVIFIFFGVIQCSKKNPLSSEEEFLSKLTSLDKSVVEADANFGLKLFKAINEQEKDKNLFISPLSISMALGMTYNGAHSTTQEAMQKTLELNGLSIQEVNESYKRLIELLTGLDSKVNFKIANSIWYRQDFIFEKEFLDLCKSYFSAEVCGLDFNDPNARNIINNWVNLNTNGKIKEIIDVIDPYSAMFLINAIYFKGIWKYEFDKNKTKDDLFILQNGSNVKCKMMVQEGDFQYFANSDIQAVDLPYGNGNFRMAIFLPLPEKNIDQLISEFNQENWNQWMKNFTKRKGNIQLPKFKLEYEIKLNDVLKSLGMKIAFDPENADFTKMYKSLQRLYIHEVKHKTFVDVNEEGTEASAVTSVEMRVTSIGPEIFIMRVDHPFIFVIHEDLSNTILFIGKIIEPKI